MSSMFASATDPRLAAALEAWVRTAGAGYGEPDDVLQARLAVHTSLGLTPGLPLRRYLARLDGQSVAMSAYFLAAGVVGVYDVATIPTARRQGFGAAITLAPLLAAHELGYRVGVLESLPMAWASTLAWDSTPAAPSTCTVGNRSICYTAGRAATDISGDDERAHGACRKVARPPRRPRTRPVV